MVQPHGLDDGRNESDNEQEGSEIFTNADDLKKYFDPMLYTNWTEGSGGTYALIESLFRTLSEEEEETALEQGKRDEFVPLPLFGDSKSSWETSTKRFYESWLKFNTAKLFEWYDVHRLSDAMDRKSRRAMENENQRAREEARKNFNETVRMLVAFIRKRDPRFKAHSKRSGGTKKSSEKTNTAAAQAQALRDRQANKKEKTPFEAQSWQKEGRENYDDFVTSIAQSSEKRSGFGEDRESSDDDNLTVFECSVCRKIFKTAQQAAEHEKSKKHLKALQKLEWNLKKQGHLIHTNNQVYTTSNPGSIDRKVCDDGNNSGNECESKNDSETELTDNADELYISTESELESDSAISAKRYSLPNGEIKGKKSSGTKEAASTTGGFTCLICDDAFASRVGLLDHIKASGHGSSKNKKRK